MVIITKNISEQDNDISSQLSHPFKSYFFKKMVMSGIGHKQPCFTYLPTFSAMLLFLFLLFSPVAGYTVESIKVGVLHSLTGPMASKEKVLKDTLLMLIDEVNKKGGILGKRLVPVVVDPASKPALFEEKARQLMEDERVDVIFGCWDSAARKAVLPVLEELNGLLFYPARHEGQESSKYVFYTGGVPNQQAIPAVSYLMNEVGVQRWVLIGSNALYPRTINKILSLYLKGQGVSSRVSTSWQ